LTRRERRRRVRETKTVVATTIENVWKMCSETYANPFANKESEWVEISGKQNPLHYELRVFGNIK